MESKPAFANAIHLRCRLTCSIFSCTLICNPPLDLKSWPTIARLFIELTLAPEFNLSLTSACAISLSKVASM
jgi:hypothetical protein